MWVSREMDEKKNVKICFAASSGGHYEQLMMLKPLMEKYDSFVITEKTDYSAEAKGEKTYYMKQVNRREKDFIWRMIQNAWKSIGIYRKEKPDALVMMLVIWKLHLIQCNRQSITAINQIQLTLSIVLKNI